MADVFSKKKQKITIRHIGNMKNNLKRTSKTGRNVGSKDTLISENPGNNLKFNVFKLSLLLLGNSKNSLN